MQSAAGAQVFHLHLRSHHSQPLITNATSSTTSSPLSSSSSPPPSSNTSTLRSDDLPEHEATKTSQQHYTDIKHTSSLLACQHRGLSSFSHSPQGGPPRKRRKTYPCRSSSLDRGSNIYRHWTTKSFKPSLAINVPTSPIHTTLLWQLVMAGLSDHDLRSERGSNPGRGNNMKGGSAGEVENPPKKGKSQGSASGQTYPSSSCKTPSTSIKKTSRTSETSSKRKTPSNADSRRNSPYNSDFVQSVLDPRSIKIFDKKQFPDTAYAHFGIQVPETRHVAAIDPTKKLPESSIWIDTTDSFVKRVTKRYTDMLSRKLCEAEFATYAKEKLLKRDDIADDEETDVREWRSERWVELVAKPEPKDTWVAPPIVEGPESTSLISSSEYSFDVRPDCSYWLSLKAFSQEYRSYVHQLIHTIHKKFISPYLTIEFKRDLDAEVVVKNQVAAASSLALYNRFRLREQRLELTQNIWTKEDLIMDIRHYGLTMQGSQYEIWCITPTLSEVDRWAGCEMKLIGYGHCDDRYDVRGFVNWINEIHYWGLTVHGPSCQNDAKYMLSKMCKGIRPSDIGIEGKGKEKEIG